MVITGQEPSLVNFDPREFEECIAECTRIVVDQVYTDMFLSEGCPKSRPEDNVPVHAPGHPHAAKIFPAQSPPG